MEFQKVTSRSPLPVNLRGASSENAATAGIRNHNLLLAGVFPRRYGTVTHISKFLYSKPRSSPSFLTSENWSGSRHASPLVVMEYPPRWTTAEVSCRASDIDTATSEVSANLASKLCILHDYSRLSFYCAAPVMKRSSSL